MREGRAAIHIARVRLGFSERESPPEAGGGTPADVHKGGEEKIAFRTFPHPDAPTFAANLQVQAGSDLVALEVQPQLKTTFRRV